MSDDDIFPIDIDERHDRHRRPFAEPFEELPLFLGSSSSSSSLVRSTGSTGRSPSPPPALSSSPSPPSDQGGFDCPICLEWISERSGRILKGCGHRLCNKCLLDYVRWSGAERKRLCCPSGSCRILILEVDVRSVLPDETDFARWQHANLQAFLLGQPNIYNCLTVDCPFAVALPSGARSFRCSVCLELNCLDCLAVHSDQTCADYQHQRQQSASDEAASELLIGMLTKRCPNCRMAVLKEESCNHVQCRCGSHFCQCCLAWASSRDQWLDMRHFAADDATCPLSNIIVVVKSSSRADPKHPYLVKICRNHVPARITFHVHHEDGTDPGPPPARTVWVVYAMGDCVLSVQNDVGEIPFIQKGGSTRLRQEGVLPLATIARASAHRQHQRQPEPEQPVASLPAAVGPFQLRPASIKLLTWRSRSLPITFAAAATDDDDDDDPVALLEYHQSPSPERRLQLTYRTADDPVLSPSTALIVSPSRWQPTALTASSIPVAPLVPRYFYRRCASPTCLFGCALCEPDDSHAGRQSFLIVHHCDDCRGRLRSSHD